ncbi:MAG: CvpA family protein [Magnetococcales bacterium]|nr:CvpA family protein [Magnetococcales bacterium]
MNGLDYILLIFVGSAALMGGLRGIRHEGAAALGWLLALATALLSAGYLEPHLAPFFSQSAFGGWLAMVVAFLMTLPLAFVATSWWVRRGGSFPLQPSDRISGVCMGSARGILILFCGILLYLGTAVEPGITQSHSRILPLMSDASHALSGLLPEESSLRVRVNANHTSLSRASGSVRKGDAEYGETGGEVGSILALFSRQGTEGASIHRPAVQETKPRPSVRPKTSTTVGPTTSERKQLDQLFQTIGSQ